MSANDRTGVGSGSAEWRTPPSLFEALNRRYEFDYDAFASHENALRERYSTVDGTFGFSYAAEGQYPQKLSALNGLDYPWLGLRVYMNSPYSRGLIEQCIEKAWSERNNAAIIVALIPAATETRWFQEWILPYCHIDFLRPRVRFIDPETGKPGGSPPSGSVIAVFKNDWKW